MDIQTASALLANLKVDWRSTKEVDAMNLAIEALQLKAKQEQGLVVELPALVNNRSVVRRMPNGRLRCTTYATRAEAEAAQKGEQNNA